MLLDLGGNMLVLSPATFLADPFSGTDPSWQIPYVVLTLLERLDWDFDKAQRSDWGRQFHPRLLRSH